MSKESLEHLSSLMDGELSRETGLFMTRRLSSDTELCKAWRRYHLIRDCIRQPGSNGADVDLSGRIRAALAAEVAEPVRQLAGRRWLKPAAGFAIAASVALVAILAIGPGPQPVDGGSNVATASDPFTSPNPLPAVPISQPASFNPRGNNPAASARLNSYLVRHNQLAGAAGRQGFVSFVPIISTQSTAGQEQDSDEQVQAENAGTRESLGNPAPQSP